MYLANQVLKGHLEKRIILSIFVEVSSKIYLFCQHIAKKKQYDIAAEILHLINLLNQKFPMSWNFLLRLVQPSLIP